MSASYPKVLKIGTQAAYNAIASKDETVLYFTSDTHKIYRGDVDFTEYAKVVATLPSATADLAVGTIYLAEDTGKVSFYDGSDWYTVSYPTVTSFDDESADDNHVATTEAIVEYVASVIGGSSDVVKSLAAGSTPGVVTYTTADDVDHDVTVPGVFVDIDDKEVADVAQPGQFTLTDSDGTAHDYTVKKVMTGIEADATDAATIDVTMTSGTHSNVVVPKVMTGVAADDTDAATLNVTLSSGSHADVVVPKVVTGVAAKTGGTAAAGKLAITLSSGSHADVTVPGVFVGAALNDQTRVITFTDSDGQTSTIDLGKDIFIDSSANNRYENGNIYLYLNDGTASKDPTEIVIPVTGLITDYVGYDTDSVDMNVDNSTHHVTANVIRRPDVAGTFTNALKLSTTAGAKGLYVDLSDVEESIDALAEAITWGTF